MKILFNEFSDNYEIQDETGKIRGFVWLSSSQKCYVVSIDEVVKYTTKKRQAFELAANLILENQRQ